VQIRATSAEASVLVAVLNRVTITGLPAYSYCGFVICRLLILPTSAGPVKGYPFKVFFKLRGGGYYKRRNPQGPESP